MEVIISKLKHSLELEKYIKGDSCFIDIETTGLKRDTSMIYLIGLLYYDKLDNNWTLKQYFAQSKEDELATIESFLIDSKPFDTIITYNGDSFDIPFINHRLNVLKSKNSFENHQSFDLYRIIKKNKDFLNLENLKLKTVEEYLGYYREDIYSGYDCISFYKDYLKTNDLSLKEKVLKHNSDDLFHMLDIIQILDTIREIKTIKLKTPDDISKFIIDDISFVKDTMKVYGDISPILKYDLKFYENNYTIITNDKSHFLFTINLSKGYIEPKVTSNYIDINDYPNFNLQCKYNEFYSIPKNIFLLSIKNKPLLINIKNLLKEFIHFK